LINFNRVDFPAPFLPIIPSTSPWFTSKLISFSAHIKSSEVEVEVEEIKVEVEVKVERLLALALTLASVLRLFSCPIINVGSGKPCTLYHQRCRSPFKVLVPIKPKRYCLETFSILITVDIGIVGSFGFIVYRYIN